MPSERLSIHPVQLADDGLIPNNRLPLLHYRQAFDLGNDGAETVEAVFHGNGWGDSWRNSVYSYHHYHSTAHEVLGCYRGSATIQFGGENGATVEFAAGDAVLIPAGVAHKKLDEKDGFSVVGAYPPHQSHDMCYGKKEERPQADANIARVPLPDTDPVCGKTGEGIHQHWPGA